MRRSKLFRSAIVVASLAVGASALVAAPAQAAAPDGVTREKILTLVEAVRAGQSQRPLLVDVLTRGCAVNSAAGEAVTFVRFRATVASTDTDGLVMYGRVTNSTNKSVRECVIAAVTASAPRFTLRGGSSVIVTTTKLVNGQEVAAGRYTVTTALSGSVSLSTPFTPPAGEFVNLSAVTAGGTAVSTQKKVTDKKSKAEKRSAKKAYSKRIKAAKKSYKKALKKAVGNTVKQATAQRSYANKRARATAKYEYAIAGYKIVKRKNAVKRPFSIASGNLTNGR